MKQKRYQYWGFKDGKPQILWTEWFECNENENKTQLKGFKNNDLKSEYREL